jgi:UDP-GlcNAc:undecaprenyl-phosphate/decaprenyl-phosphate GlcNAc-1-phosphate transferase
MTTSVLLTGVSSFLVGWVLILALRPWAAWIGLLDHPDGRRKQHARPTPLCGGIAVLLAVGLTSLAALTVTAPEGRDFFGRPGLLVAAAVVFGIGVADDYWGLRGRHKLLGQLVAVAIAVSSGLVIENVHLFGWQLSLGAFAIPFTAFWLLGAINACNLLDGLDGFLSTIAAVACLGLVVVGLATGQLALALVAAALLGALLAFLCFNFPPATVYLGDAGSMLVGLLLGVLTLQGVQVGPGSVALMGPLVLFAVPIVDTLAAILRRALTGRSIYTTDRGHIHHWLLRQGRTPRQILVLAAELSLIGVLGLTASRVLHHDLLALAAGLVVGAMLIGGHGFGLAEAQLVRERLVGLWLRLLPADPARAVRQMQVRLQGSLDWTGLWQAAIDQAEQTGLVELVLDVNAPAFQEGFHARWHRPGDAVGHRVQWRTQMPLIVDGQCIGRLEFTAGREQLLARESFQHLMTLTQAVESGVALLLAAPLAETPAPAPAPRFVADSKRTALSPVSR